MDIAPLYTQYYSKSADCISEGLKDPNDQLLPELMTKIFLYHYTNLSCVNTKWKNSSANFLGNLIKEPKNVYYGKEFWKRIGIKMDASPLLPSTIRKTMAQVSILNPEKKDTKERINDTHELILVPSTDDFKKLASSTYAHAEDLKPFIELFDKYPNHKAHWILISKHYLAASASRSYSDQKKVAEKIENEVAILEELLAYLIIRAEIDSKKEGWNSNLGQGEGNNLILRCHLDANHYAQVFATPANGVIFAWGHEYEITVIVNYSLTGIFGVKRFLEEQAVLPDSNS